MSRHQRTRHRERSRGRAALTRFRAAPLRLSPRSTDYLLRDLCVQMGFCLPPADHDRIVGDPTTDPHAFAMLVMALEGVGADDPDMVAAMLEVVSAAFLREEAERARP